MNEKQMGLDCIEIITKKLNKEMTRDEYYQALIELHNKYPMSGHEPPLTSYQIRNCRSIKELIKDPDSGVAYLDKLQPFNFLEAAEMYKQSMDKRDEECLTSEAWRQKTWPLTRKFQKQEPKQEHKERLPYADDTEEVPF